MPFHYKYLAKEDGPTKKKVFFTAREVTSLEKDDEYTIKETFTPENTKNITIDEGLSRFLETKCQGERLDIELHFDAESLTQLGNKSFIDSFIATFH